MDITHMKQTKIFNTNPEVVNLCIENIKNMLYPTTLI
jgi:hypothetical protein